METGFMNRITGLVIALVVGGLLVGGLLIPSIEGMTATEATRTNTGAYFTTPDGGEHEIIISTDTITYDGKTCIYPDLGLYGSATALIGSDWFLRLERSGSGVSFIVAGPNQQYDNLGNSTNGNLTITINGESVNMTGPTNTIAKSTLQYTIADKGDYVLSHKPYVLENTTFIGGIRNNTGNGDIFEIVSGTLNDPAGISTTSCRCYSNDLGLGAVSSSEYTINLTPVAENLKKLAQIDQTAEITYTGGTATANITIDYVIVPAKIVYDNPSYIGNTNAVIMGVISLLGIVALIVLAANAVKNKY